MRKKVVSIDAKEVVERSQMSEPTQKVGSEAYREVTLYDSDGQIIVSVFSRSRQRNGGGFVLSYTNKMSEFLESTREGSYVRLFMYIAQHQQFGNDDTYGYRCSRRYLQKVMSLDRKTVYRALNYLKSNYLVHERVSNGVSEFMVNPQYITVGADKKARVREWNDRWQETNRTISLRRLPTPAPDPVAIEKLRSRLRFIDEMISRDVSFLNKIVPEVVIDMMSGRNVDGIKKVIDKRGLALGNNIVEVRKLREELAAMGGMEDA